MVNSNMLDDRKLVQEFLRTRSEAAFLTLYRSKTPHLYQMAMHLTFDDYASEELIQEMWMVAIRKLPQFEWRSELKTWLIGILINLSKSRLRAESSTVVLESMEMVEDEVSFDFAYSTQQDLEKAISQLPEGYKQAIILHDIEGYKHKEIANLLKVSEGTSKSQLFHARKAIRTYLSERTIKNAGHE